MHNSLHPILKFASLAVVAGCLAGCGAQRWFPTDPRLADMNTSNFSIAAHLEIGVGTTITAASLLQKKFAGKVRP